MTHVTATVPTGWGLVAMTVAVLLFVALSVVGYLQLFRAGRDHAAPEAQPGPVRRVQATVGRSGPARPRRSRRPHPAATGLCAHR